MVALAGTLNCVFFRGDGTRYESVSPRARAASRNRGPGVGGPLTLGETSAWMLPLRDPRSHRTRLNRTACRIPNEFGRGDWIRTSDPLRPRRKNPHNWGQLETAAP